MAKPPASGTPFSVVCPHCKKEFEAPLLADAAHRQQGFKCPHCRLFVSYEQDRAEPSA